MKNVIFGLVFASLLVASVCFGQSLPERIQSQSVTVKVPGGEGSGTFITRTVKDGDKEIKVNFVWSAAHVVDTLRSVRDVIDAKTGQTKKIIEFKDAEIVQEVIEDGRRVGEFKMNAKVIKYSHAEFGEDLALMMVRKKALSESNTEFLLDGDKIVAVGTELYHCGSLLGQVGANSLMQGSLSQIGRTLDLNNGEQVLFDQVAVNSFPGSSGGGVFLKSNAKYMGMLVRGGGENFGLVVPVRRMWNYCEKQNIKWAMDTNEKVPSLKEILELPVE